MIRSFAYGAVNLALPLLIASTTAEAQRGRGKDQLSDAAIAARRACFEEAQARVPQRDGSMAVQNRRTAIYKDCAHRKGVRP